MLNYLIITASVQQSAYKDVFTCALECSVQVHSLMQLAWEDVETVNDSTVFYDVKHLPLTKLSSEMGVLYPSLDYVPVKAV